MVASYVIAMAERTHRINILEMHSSFGYAGGQRNMVTFCRYLRRDLFTVYAAAYREGGVQEQVLKHLGVEYMVSPGMAEPILRFIQEKKIDVLHIHRSGGSVPLETAIIRGAKVINPDLIVIEKNVFGHYDPSTRGLIDVSFFQSMMHVHERYLRPAAGISYNPLHHKVLYNMVDATAFASYVRQPSEIMAYKKTLGISPDDIVIGRIGRPDLAKWSDLILDMLPHLLRIVPQVKCILMGVPESRIRRIQNSPLRDAIIILKDVGDESQVHLFYQTIDILAHASKIGECNGNTLNEALYWGKPVVVNSTPKKDNGQLEQIIHGEHGYIANDPYTFARAVADLALNPDKRRQMGQCGHDRMVQEQNPQKITQQIEKFCVELYQSRGVVFLPEVIDFYANTRYHPSDEDISQYKALYPVRLQQTFGKKTAVECLMGMLHAPSAFYQKLRDFYDHRRQ